VNFVLDLKLVIIFEQYIGYVQLFHTTNYHAANVQNVQFLMCIRIVAKKCQMHLWF